MLWPELMRGSDGEKTRIVPDGKNVTVAADGTYVKVSPDKAYQESRYLKATQS
jgi:hypothetical protein